MNRYTIAIRTITLLSLSLLVGWTTPDQKADNPDKSKLGVLVIAGEGLNTKYDDPRVANIWLVASQEFAEALNSEIEKRGTKAQVYINRDGNVSAKTYVADLFATKKRDGIVQVSIMQTKNEAENSVYLSATYNPLQWVKVAEGDSFIIGRGPVAKYKILGDGSEGRNTPLAQFAKEFADTLYKAGYIGGEQANAF